MEITSKQDSSKGKEPRGTTRHMTPCIARDRRRMKKSWRNVEYTLGERTQLGSKIPRVRGGKSPKTQRDSVEELKNCLGEPWRHKERSGEWNRGSSVLRGMRPPYIYPWNLRAKYVQAGSWTCPGQGPDMLGKIWLSGFQKNWPDMSSKGADVSGHIRTELTRKPLESLIIDGFGVYANSSTYSGHRWTSFEKQNIHMAWKQ
jgi:hypothetical protein